MTREEQEAAIAYIKCYRKLDEDLHNTAPKDSISYYATDKCLKYWDMAIQALSSWEEYSDKLWKKAYERGKTEALSQEPCADAVSRADVIELIEQGVGNKSVTIDGFTFGKSLMLYHIKQLPSVTQKSGEWIDYSDEGFVECPICGHATTCEDNIDELHYCFYCGARMVKPQGSSEDELKDLSQRVENIEKQMKEDKEEQLKKLKAELDYAKFCCALYDRK